MVTGDVNDAATLFLTDAGVLKFGEEAGGDVVTSNVSVDAVPEPASLSLFAIGALGALAARRARRNS